MDRIQSHLLLDYRSIQGYAEPMPRPAKRPPRPSRHMASALPPQWCQRPGQAHGFGPWVSSPQPRLDPQGRLGHCQRRLCWRCGQRQLRQLPLEQQGGPGCLLLYGPRRQLRLLPDAGRRQG